MINIVLIQIALKENSVKEVYKGSNDGWYGDYSYLASSESPWFKRGGFYSYGTGAGVFISYNGYGNASSYYSSRLIITP